MMIDYCTTRETHAAPCALACSGIVATKTAGLTGTTGGNCMIVRRVMTWGVAAFIVLAGLSLPVSYARAAEDADIAKQVQSAKTAADHEAIAKAYDEKSAAAKANAAEHRRMAESYKGISTSIGKGAGVSAMPQHCEALAKSFDAEAEHYAAMAQTHRDLAKTIK
jgi:hypothetical protein